MGENSGSREWFAALADPYDDDWSLGSYDPNEAAEMSKRYDPETTLIVGIEDGKIVESFRPLWVYTTYVY